MEELLENKKVLKFLCSHGGKIMPRPPDGQLKYVGGETRVVAVPRNISFSELKKKLTALCNAEMVLKYQVIPEDLDILVSVTCDEDLHHMFNEYDRCDSSNCGTPRLRAFLFPPNPLLIPADNQSTASSNVDPHDIEQRYIDAINGIPNSMKRSLSNANRSIFSISSCGSSPRSNAPSDYGHSDQDVFMPNANGYLNSFDKEIHKVNSSPSLYNLANQYQHSYHPSPVQQPPFYHSSKAPQGLYKGGPERLMTALSVGRSDLGKCQLGHHPPPMHYYPRSRSQRVYNAGFESIFRVK